MNMNEQDWSDMRDHIADIRNALDEIEFTVEYEGEDPFADLR